MATIDYYSQISDVQTQDEITESRNAAVATGEDGTQIWPPFGSKPRKRCTPEDIKAILAAVAANDLEKTEALIDNGVDVNSQDEEKGGIPLIYLASMSGHAKMVRLLARRGADVNACKRNGASSVFIAAQAAHLDVLKALIQVGADLNLARRVDRATPLFKCAQKGHVEVAQVLLDAGAIVDRQDDTGATPLFIAAQEGHIHMVRLLLKSGADATKARDDGITPISKADEKGHTAVAEILLDSIQSDNCGCEAAVQKIVSQPQKPNTVQSSVCTIQ